MARATVRGLNVLAATVSTQLAAPVTATVRQRRLSPPRWVVDHRGRRDGTGGWVQCHDRGADGLTHYEKPGTTLQGRYLHR